MGQKSFHSPIGEITLSADDFGEGMGLVSVDEGWGRDQDKEDAFLNKAEKAFQDYFDGKCQDFKGINLLPFGTDFQKKVWAEIAKIPYGQTTTYGEIGEKIGNVCSRAVGRAVGANPLPIIIPCHRVMGKNNRMTGYSFGDGVETKKFLLNLEKHFSSTKDF